MNLKTEDIMIQEEIDDLLKTFNAVKTLIQNQNSDSEYFTETKSGYQYQILFMTEDGLVWSSYEDAKNHSKQILNSDWDDDTSIGIAKALINPNIYSVPIDNDDVIDIDYNL